MTHNNERAAFEAWYGGHHESVTGLAEQIKEARWEAWQTRAALADVARATDKTRRALDWFLREHKKASEDWEYSIDLRHFKEIVEEALK
jgi:hypothetical protein